MNLHSKQKGMLGHLTVARDLIKKGYSVFTEFGDLSKVDLITIINYKLIKIQVKSITKTNGSIGIRTWKVGPNYKYKYSEKDVDVFAFFVLNHQPDLVLYMNAKKLLNHKNGGGMIIRIDKTRNNQKKNVNYFDKYLSIESQL